MPHFKNMNFSNKIKIIKINHLNVLFFKSYFKFFKKIYFYKIKI